ncbi:putative ammonium transporter 2 isoform X2 [Apostichopus japonicus]|uniref:putative ammonium transporter 2 isoform X2 n=1 Tax=Stichopus japonicus TaxID=307972 RepID=UPI003AB67234
MEDVTSEMNASNNCVCNFNTTDSFSDVENCSSTVTITGNPWDDATWVLTSAFVIFTMQSGFGLLESGTATAKNEVNIMIKNAVDVIFGGFSFYIVGYGLSFGDLLPDNGFIGFGLPFSVGNDNHFDQGYNYTYFIFQLAFSTTTTTIVSGAMIERTRLEAYIIFSVVNTIQSSFPVRWVWEQNGFLRKLGVIDVAGGGVVHVVGGITGLVATLILRPRHRRYKMKRAPPMGSPTNVVLGMFMLWSAIATINASIGGGITGIFLSYITKRRKFELSYLVSSVLGSLVSVTAMCTMASPRLAIVIGVVGGFIACGGIELLNYLHVDDPVGVVPVHLFCGIWSLIAAGLFVPEDDMSQGYELYGLINGGGTPLLLVQLLAAVCIIAWCSLFSAIVLFLLSSTIGLRLSYHEELLGADMVEHNIGDREYDKANGKLMSSPKWLKRLESQGIVKQRRGSIREAEQMTDAATNKLNRFHSRSRSHRRLGLGLPSFKIIPSPLRNLRKPTTHRRRQWNSCRPIIKSRDNDGKITGLDEIVDPNRLSNPAYNRRGARRVHGPPLKWPEVLGVSEETVKDIEVLYGSGNDRNAFHTKYSVISRDQGTQTDDMLLLNNQQWSFMNMHRHDVTNMHRYDVRNVRKKLTLDEQVWNSLYEHMV